MAVEVVGQDETVKKRKTCDECGAILEFTSQDVFTHKYYCTGKPESDPAIKCPQCENIVLLDYGEF